MHLGRHVHLAVPLLLCRNGPCSRFGVTLDGFCCIKYSVSSPPSSCQLRGSFSKFCISMCCFWCSYVRTADVQMWRNCSAFQVNWGQQGNAQGHTRALCDALCTCPWWQRLWGAAQSSSDSPFVSRKGCRHGGEHHDAGCEPGAASLGGGNG